MTRPLPPIPDRLIVALDVPEVAQAQALVDRLDGAVTFFKVGYWLLLQPGVHGLIDGLVARGRRVFLDCKMYDIGETVRRGVESAARRGVSILTVHGDPAIMQAAVEGRGGSALQLFAISVLTSLDDDAVRAMGYDRPVADLVRMRAAAAVACGCDGLIASAADDPDAIRAAAGHPGLLIGTPGIRMPGADRHDQLRAATPDAAIERGADYLVVGRPITQAPDPAAAAEAVIAAMQAGWQRRQAR